VQTKGVGFRGQGVRKPEGVVRKSEEVWVQGNAAAKVWADLIVYVGCGPHLVGCVGLQLHCCR
jgi:hypothetical protein